MRTLVWTTISLLLASLSAAAYDVDLAWTHDGSGPPDGFRVESMTYGGSWAQIGNVSAAGTKELKMTDVPTGSRQYRVNAYNRVGGSEWVYSPWVIVGDKPETEPQPATDLSVTIGVTVGAGVTQ